MSLSRRVSPFEIKAFGDGGTFEGYASVFNVVDSYADTVAPGAFTRTLQEASNSRRMPAMLWQHDTSQPIGVWTDLTQDEHGLYVKGMIADTTAGRDAYQLLKVGALSGLSIGYRTVKSRVNKDTAVRKLLDLDLMEISPVTFPANDAARVRSVKATEWDAREWEAQLRDVCGLSQRQAKAFIADGLRGLRRDAAAAAPSDAEMLAAIYRATALLQGEE